MIHIEIVPDTMKVLKGLTLEKMRKNPRKYVMFMTIEQFHHTFSPERQKLLGILRREGAMSISDLAKKAGRRFEAVHRDLRYLEGIVKFRKEDKRVIPYITEGINVSMLPADV